MTIRQYQGKINKLPPRHPYGTRSKTGQLEGIMEDLTHRHEELKDEVNQLKEQVGEILELLRSMQNTGGDSSKQPQAATSYPPPGFTPPQANPQFPPYGLPPGYTPPMADQPEEGQVVFNKAPANNGASQTHLQPSTAFTGPQEPARPKPLHVGNEPETEYPAYTTTTENIGAKGRLEILEERLRMIEGNKDYGFGDAAGLCLTPNLVIPPKFKAPEFKKYEGISCPKNHLTMYCRRMASHARDDKMLIHFFQDSLSGVALNWYVHLEPSHIRSWKDLADAFLKQYKYNMDMALDRSQLQEMAKKDTEAFKEYA